MQVGRPAAAAAATATRRWPAAGRARRSLLRPAVGLGPDPLLLEADLLDLVADPLFGGGRVVLARPGVTAPPGGGGTGGGGLRRGGGVATGGGIAAGAGGN